MKIDFSQKLSGPNGEEIENLTLGKVALTALNTPDKEPIGFDEALRRGKLALKAGKAQVTEITPEEAALIRINLSKAWTPIIVAQAADMLEG